MKSSKGFTIIELVISIFILSIAVVGIFSAFSMVVILTSNTADHLTASYLAQEGIEIVRNIRDENWLDMDTCASGNAANTLCPASWVDGLTQDGVNGSPDCTQGCEADYTTGTNSDSESSKMTPWEDRYLYLDAGGFYSYSSSCALSNSNCATKFKRRIIIAPVTDVDGNSSLYHIIKVIVQVSWDEKATILNSYIPAGSPDPNDTQNTLSCDPHNCVTAEETLYDWYNSPNSNKDITDFTFVDHSDEIITINQNTHTITVILPSTTDPGDLGSLTATFKTTGSFVSFDTAKSSTRLAQIGSNVQDPNRDFSDSVANPVVYTVHAADGTIQPYNVTVTIASVNP